MGTICESARKTKEFKPILPSSEEVINMDQKNKQKEEKNQKEIRT